MSLNATIDKMEEQPNMVGNVRIPISAGLLARGTVREWLRYAQSHSELKINYFENKGLIDSEFTIEIDGEARNIAKVLRTLKDSGIQG